MVAEKPIAEGPHPQNRGKAYRGKANRGKATEPPKFNEKYNFLKTFSCFFRQPSFILLLSTPCLKQTRQKDNQGPLILIGTYANHVKLPDGKIRTSFILHRNNFCIRAEQQYWTQR